ncbi:hypothetical protein, partial [Rhodomicrobium udaipurense]|uniref:hypothetical protein n=1 Tax=Rhodomicrobium udaipurense TaxID=1202716 RepID=UPI001AEC1922
MASPTVERDFRKIGEARKRNLRGRRFPPGFDSPKVKALSPITRNSCCDFWRLSVGVQNGTFEPEEIKRR